MGRPKVSPAVTQLHPDAEAIFKDSYLVDFLGLPEVHSEQELQTAIIGTRKSIHRRIALRIEGQRSRGIRVEPRCLARSYRGISDPLTR
jgi:hypothetical protein